MGGKKLFSIINKIKMLYDKDKIEFKTFPFIQLGRFFKGTILLNKYLHWKVY